MICYDLSCFSFILHYVIVSLYLFRLISELNVDFALIIFNVKSPNLNRENKGGIVRAKEAT